MVLRGHNSHKASLSRFLRQKKNIFLDNRSNVVYVQDHTRSMTKSVYSVLAHHNIALVSNFNF